MSQPPTLEEIRRAPKVLLHDHLDGGLRPETIVDLARETGYDGLPATDAEACAPGSPRRSNSGSLERYLETFDHTVGVMQTREALIRVAAECAEDLADDGVVYAEVRYAPEQHTSAGLSLEEVVEAVQEGFRASARERGRGIRVGTLLTAMRHAGRGHGDRRAGGPLPRRRRGRIRHRRRRGGLPAHPPPRRLRVPPARERPLHHPRRRGVRPAVDLAGDPVVRRRPARPRGAHHRRHRGARDDGTAKLGRLAAYVRDKRIPLEMCPTSNLQTGARDLHRRAPDRPAAQPELPGHGQHRQPADERHLACPRSSPSSTEAFGYGWDDLQWFTVNAMKSAFMPFDERLALINGVIKPGFARLKWQA